MNIDSVLNTLDTSGVCGYTITTEESIILYNSLLILQNENHFRKAFFWGKIFGTDKDYYIAYGYQDDALHGRTFYYSTNCINWGLLPLPSDHALLLTPLCTTLFNGDPALVTDILIEKFETHFGKVVEAPMVKKLKEEDRLAATVHFINEEAFVLPRGGLFRRPDGVVVENLSFEGLTDLESREIKSFLHYRKPRQKWNTNLLTRDDYNYAIDFLDPLDLDIPEGVWHNQLLEGDTTVFLKPMHWPGLIFYHQIKTPRYGNVYFGNGKKRIDMPFQLSPFL